MNEVPNLRYAVGSFESWLRLRSALDDLCLHGFAPASFSCLALQRVFESKPFGQLRDLDTAGELAFPEDREPVGCTAGPLRDCLLDRAQSGAQTLEEAFRHWMVPRHAAQLRETVQKAKIQLWIRLETIDDERRACKGLLANSSNSVGVHDLVATAAPTLTGSLRQSPA